MSVHQSTKWTQPGLLMKYFVLKPGGRTAYHAASRAAMRAYAAVIREENPVLAAELETWSASTEQQAALPLVVDEKVGIGK
jgi:hypothetical protein